MKSLFVFAVLCAAVALAYTPNWYNSWVVLVAGADGWDSYPTQSSVLKLYQIFRRNGVPDSRIITFFADDIAYNDQNPFPGAIYNEEYREGGGNVNVYQGVPKDYTGDNANADSFVNALTGVRPAVGSGKLLKPSTNEDVFFFYAGDGGYSNTVRLPKNNEYISRNDFIKVINNITTRCKRTMVIMDNYYSDNILSGFYAKNAYLIGSNIYSSDNRCLRDIFVHQYVQRCWTHFFTNLLETKSFSINIEDMYGAMCDYKTTARQYGDSLVKNMTFSYFMNSYGANTLLFPNTPVNVPGLPFCASGSCVESKCDCYAICKRRGYPDDRCKRLCCWC